MSEIKLVMMEGEWERWVPALREISPKVNAIAVKDADLMSEVGDAEVVYGRIPRDAFLAARQLRWVQSIGVGFETMLYPEMIESDVIMTNTAGAYDTAMAEHAISLILASTRLISHFERNRKTRTWERNRTVTQIEGRCVCVLGLGSIGRGIVSRLHALGMEVIAVDAQVKTPPEGVDRIFKPEGMLEALSLADVVAVALPLNARTKGLLNAECFDHMKETALVVNVARGDIINESDLIQALQSNKIGGAGLDVFEQEPLLESSPLWDMENVVLTPHVAGWSAEGWDNQGDIFVENLRRYLEGEPLLNVVDKRLGYLVQKP